MTDYTLNANATLALEVLDFVKKRLENCQINEDKKEYEIKRIEDVKKILHKKLRLEPVILNDEVHKNSLDVIKSALTVYKGDSEAWISDKEKFKKIKRSIDDELGLKMYDDRDAKLFDQYYKCFKKEPKF